jgi:hypothetical protein
VNRFYRITGRYNFPGIQKAMGFTIDTLVAGTSWGAWILASPFKPVINAVRDLIDNWFINRGLIILNVGVNIIDGSLDQEALDNALNQGIKRVMQGRDKITLSEGNKIDDAVRKAFDRDADLGGVSKLPGPPV